MNKKSKTAGLRIITTIITAAVLIGVYTIKGNRLPDELSGSVETSDILTNDTSQKIETGGFSGDTEINIGALTETDKNSDINKVKTSDSDTLDVNKETSSDNSSDIDSDYDSDTDTEDEIDTDIEGESGTIFPYGGVWNLIVVNKYNPIPENYEFTLTELDNGKKVDSRIYNDLQEMLAAMRSAGVYPDISEAYRTNEEQEAIMQNYINDFIAQDYTQAQAEAEAKRWVALPGTSEHQIGLSLDINADTNYCSNEIVYSWLADNAYKYGFILRYPSGKENITGIDYEPWHYRYVGSVAAEEIYNKGECLEEYLME